jgi:hypothetical protein
LDPTHCPTTLTPLRVDARRGATQHRDFLIDLLITTLLASDLDHIERL